MKKIIIIVVAVVLIISGTAAYFLTKPDVTISIGKPVDDMGAVDVNAPMYVEHVSIGYGGYLSAKNKNKLSLFTTETEKQEKDIYNNYGEPTHIEVDVKFENNQTIITYHGTATEKGTKKEVEYNEVVTLDFILTENISETN